MKTRFSSRLTLPFDNMDSKVEYRFLYLSNGRKNRFTWVTKQHQI